MSRWELGGEQATLFRLDTRTEVSNTGAPNAIAEIVLQFGGTILVEEALRRLIAQISELLGPANLKGYRNRNEAYHLICYRVCLHYSEIRRDELVLVGESETPDGWHFEFQALDRIYSGDVSREGYSLLGYTDEN